MAMPNNFALRAHNGKYLQFVRGTGEKCNLACSAADVVSPFTKFRVVESGNGDGLVSIQCVYNNKYLSAVSKTDMSIAAVALEPDTAASSWSCTLFELTYAGHSSTLLLRHSHSTRYFSAHRDNDNVALSASGDGQEPQSFFKVADTDSLVVLPRYMSLKSQSNGLYLKYYNYVFSNFLQFDESDLASSLVPHESLQVGDGTLQFKCLYNGCYWTFASNEWIYANGTTSSAVPANVFYPIKLDDTTLALYSSYKGLYLQKHSFLLIFNCLGTASSTITADCKFSVAEPVSARKVDDIQFNVDDASITHEEPAVLFVTSRANYTNAVATIDVTLQYTDTYSSAFTNSLTFKSTVLTDFQTNIPIIADDGTVTVSSDIGGTFTWDTAAETTKTANYTKKLTLPAMTEATLKVVATKGTCSVPFSYSQTDTLFTGTAYTNTMVDGVYTGTNYYNITAQEPEYTPLS